MEDLPFWVDFTAGPIDGQIVVDPDHLAREDQTGTLALGAEDVEHRRPLLSSDGGAYRPGGSSAGPARQPVIGLIFGEQDSFINHIAMSLRANPIFYLMPGRGEVVLHPIHIDDLIQTLLRSLRTIEVVDSVVEIGGPENFTQHGVVEVFEEQLMHDTNTGRPRTVTTRVAVRPPCSAGTAGATRHRGR